MSRRHVLRKFTEAVAKLPKVVLDARLEIEDTSWGLGSLGDINEEDVSEFLEIGRKLAIRLLEKQPGAKRIWRLYPYTMSEEATKDHLMATGHEKAARWIEEGL